MEVLPKQLSGSSRTVLRLRYTVFPLQWRMVLLNGQGWREMLLSGSVQA
jgi:hypothetical protein